MQMLIHPSGTVILRLSPRGEEPKIASWMLGLVRKGLPFPTEIQTAILDFAGQVWFSQRSGRDRNLASFTGSYAIECPETKARRLLKAVLPFRQAELRFSDMSKVYVEWGGHFQYLWARGDDLWPLIVLLRYQRNCRGQATIPMRIRGFGIVLV